MVRFLHTSDWQLGLKLSYIPGDKGALQREVRLQTLDRIVEVAKKEEVGFVVVAGDAFDDNGVGDGTIRQALERLKALDPIPIYFLPGNHDALSADSVYRRTAFQRDPPPNVHVLETIVPVLVPNTNAELLPCPLLRRHEVNDPTAHLQADEDATRIRIAVAHGSMDVLPEAGEATDRIDPAVVDRAKLDYLALGDWHGTWHRDSRIWYSGTHEQTKFNEADAGNVLVVTIDHPGATPVVKPNPVAQTRWIQRAMTLTGGEDIQALKAWYTGLSARRDQTLVELTLCGSLSLSDRQKLDDLLASQDDLLRFQRVLDADLVTAASEDDLATIAEGGFVRQAVARLAQESRLPDPEVSEDARNALQLLYRLNQKLTGETV